jgi:pimeloyl-ACP methyl ester carboxylesterase
MHDQLIRLDGRRFAMTEQMATAQTPHSRSGFAVVDGVRLAYEVAGAGSPVVLLHAGVADARMWDDQFAALAARHTVVRYDARGCGRSDPARGSFSPRADLAAVMATLGIGRAHLVGLSMGGTVALDAALERPELVAGLVLAATRPSGLAPSQALRDAWDAVDAAFEAEGFEAANELELRMWVDGPRRSPDQVDPAVRERVRVMNGALLAQPDEGEPERLEPPANERLGEVRAPTLVIVGDGDQPDVVAAAEVLERGMRGARRHVLAGPAHMVNMERPAEFNRLVLHFLAEVDKA